MHCGSSNFPCSSGRPYGWRVRVPSVACMVRWVMGRAISRTAYAMPAFSRARHPRSLRARLMLRPPLYAPVRGSGRRSNTSTWCPRCASINAQRLPTKPAPTTAIFSGTKACCTVVDMGRLVDGGFDGLVQISNEVVCVLDPYTQSDKPVRNAQLRANFCRHASVGHGRWVLD